ncbi:hypothetical protein [Jongsikchunia kroppenstedtii]|uniref:hypothetical protein n=1 Tax=Jongsikchunia kroppenstedtii TaxID=1121721 RepID=UPI0012DBE0C4|nr:hypothetical protein [Jongsikchunia kroppenstedtii]
MPLQLIDAAFGDSPGAFDVSPAAFPLGPDNVLQARWFRAVALGGLGRYAAAAADLRYLTRGPAPAAMRSLAFSATASHLRQCGQHRIALAWDGRAVSAADDAVSLADALVGLAADNLGRGEFTAAGRLLARAAEVDPAASGAASADDPWWRSGRVTLRRQWVGAELALYSGDSATARAIVEQMDADTPSLRHRLKTVLIGAATAAASGDAGEATVMAQEVFGTSHEHRQRPLQWAAAMLLRSLDPDGPWVRAVNTLSSWMYVPEVGLHRAVGAGR